MKTYRVKIESAIMWPLYKETLREALADWACTKAKANATGIAYITITGEHFVVRVDPEGAA